MFDYYNYHASEISEDELGREFKEGKVIASDYDCYLLERKTPKTFVYTALNRHTGQKFKVDSRKDMAMGEHIAKMMEIVSRLDIAGPGMMQADRKVNDEIDKTKAAEIMLYALNAVLPAYNYIVSDEQKDRAIEIMNAIVKRDMLPIEADSDDIDIICCLIAAIIVKRGRINDYYARRMYPLMQYADMPKMPIVFCVPSLQLQRRVTKELLPKISEMLLSSGIIREALTFVERKGRRNYVCKVKAKTYMAAMRHRNRRMRFKKQIFSNDELVEIDDVRWLTDKEKSNIAVDNNCTKACPQYDSCKYSEFLETAKSYWFDIQVCTHRYFIADSFNRKNSKKKAYEPQIPNYQMLLICDASNYVETVDEMYGTDIPGKTVAEIQKSVKLMSFHRSGLITAAKRDVRKLCTETARLFRDVAVSIVQVVDYNDGCPAVSRLDDSAIKHLCNMKNITERLIYALRDEAFFAKAEEILAWVHKKFGVDTTSIKLNTLMSDFEFMKVDSRGRVRAIHRAICNLFEIEKTVIAERVNRTKRRLDKSNARKSYQRYIHNTEGDAIINLDSIILDMIEEKTSRLFDHYAPVGRRSERIIRLIRKIEHLRNQIGVIIEFNDSIFWIDVKNSWVTLKAAPGDIEEIMITDHKGIGMPTILMTGKLPNGANITDFKQILGLCN